MSFKIDSIEMRNYGKIKAFSCSNFSNINLIIGENGTGKTFLLKALYSAIRSMEEYKRGDDIRSMNDILAEKLRWTFQVDKIGDMVTRDSYDELQFQINANGENYGYQFPKDTVSQITNLKCALKNKEGNSIFIPAKEVLSLFSIILKSREFDKMFGFDDTYYDLAKALRIPPSRGRNYTAFSNSRELVSDAIDGYVEYDENSGKWFYRNNKKQQFTIGATSEGVKKLAILDRLLCNGYLNRDSVIFIDEIESALHPTAICQFLDMVHFISDSMGIQFFIASHSYFVIKKLALLAMKKQNYITCISLEKEIEPIVSDLYDGIPNNSIIDTSIALYEQEIMGVLS